jgi:ABC-type dipeptide/oligopeptide/nickel transport system permease subunit
VLVYFVAAVGVWLGLWAVGWGDLTGTKWEAVSAAHWFGTNIIGQDIYDRAIFSTATAFEVGLIVAVISTLIGAVLGAFAGFFAGSWIDELLIWCMGVLDAIPFYLFVAAVAFALAESPWAMHVAMISTFWVGTARLIRGEVIKLRDMEYVDAAHSIGVPETTIIFRHILPNTSHILLVQASILFVGAIKAEVILSFLGIGIKDGMSWGLMIDESTKEVLSGFYNNFLAASLLMFGLVMAFNTVADALQDALDPRKVG